MVTISWIVTAIFTLLFAVSIMNAAKIQTPYGSPASSPAYILGLLIGHGLIPGILWLITYFTASKVNATYNQSQTPNGKAVNSQNQTPNGYSGGYSGGHNSNPSSNDYSGGYDGGHNNSNSNDKSDGYNNGDLYK